jgi:hypothetical protein
MRQQEKTDIRIADLPSEVAAALAELAIARDYARDAGCDPWEFAVELSRLTELGLTRSDLRWLVEKGYAAHAREVTREGDPARRFVSVGNTEFSPATRFLLTDAGMHLAGSSSAAPIFLRIADRFKAARSESATAPRWDVNDSILYFGDQVIKRYPRPSPNQQLILSAFEEEGWPRRVDDPLPPNRGTERKQRLRDTIRWLNRGHEVTLLAFSADGTGKGVCWRALGCGDLSVPAGSALKMRAAA